MTDTVWTFLESTDKKLLNGVKHGPNLPHYTLGLGPERYYFGISDFIYFLLNIDKLNNAFFYELLLQYYFLKQHNKLLLPSLICFAEICIFIQHCTEHLPGTYNQVIIY